MLTNYLFFALYWQTQIPEMPFGGTIQFIFWYFYGLSGLGGWFIFFLIALVATIWVLYDSQKRNLPAIGWRMAVILLTLMNLPAVLFRFTVKLQDLLNYYAQLPLPQPLDAALADLPPLTRLAEPIFYLGILGGLLPLAIAVAYYINFQGFQPPTRKGFISPPPPIPVYPPPIGPDAPPPPTPGPLPPKRPVKQAWLVTKDGSSHQLYVGETTLGRSAENDIYLSGDTTISKEHAKIVEKNNHFRLFDLGSTNGTRVNGRWVRQPVLLEPDDEVQFGDHTVMRFVTTQR